MGVPPMTAKMALCHATCDDDACSGIHGEELIDREVVVHRSNSTVAHNFENRGWRRDRKCRLPSTCRTDKHSIHEVLVEQLRGQPSPTRIDCPRCHKLLTNGIATAPLQSRPQRVLFRHAGGSRENAVSGKNKRAIFKASCRGDCSSDRGSQDITKSKSVAGFPLVESARMTHRTVRSYAPETTVARRHVTRRSRGRP